jgi:hypothetical protein
VTGGRLRTAAWAGFFALAWGPLLGTAWWLLAPDVTFVVRDSGVFEAPGKPADWFGADGWFLVLGAVLGLVVGTATFRRWRAHPVAAVLGMAFGCVLAAVLAWWLGGLLGPAPLKTQLAGAETGDLLQRPLGLRAWGVLFVPATVAVATFGALVASSSSRPEPVLSPSEPPVPSEPG